MKKLLIASIMLLSIVSFANNPVKNPNSKPINKPIKTCDATKLNGEKCTELAYKNGECKKHWQFCFVFQLPKSKQK